VADFAWKPAGPLSDRERKIDLAALRPLYEAWRSREKELQAGDPARLKKLKEQLIRRMIVEIGLLEGLYGLDRPATEKLVAGGFSVEHVLPSATSMEPPRLIAILGNQEIAIMDVLDDAAQRHPLTKAAIRKIHATQMRHQDTVAVTDASGQKKVVPLLKGEFKKASNNLALPDGSLHEFCPAEHVEREIDILLERLADYRDCDPVLTAAWLHYNLYQVHPFQTGNGRVVRAVTAYVMLQAGLLPLVVEREDRAEYKAGMLAAGRGDLTPLVNLFARAERITIERAREQSKSLVDALQ
jgi:Fic family protein